jgi:hypothetical protein
MSTGKFCRFFGICGQGKGTSLATDPVKPAQSSPAAMATALIASLWPKLLVPMRAVCRCCAEPTDLLQRALAKGGGFCPAALPIIQ